MSVIRDRAWYLWVGFVLPPIIIFLQSVAPFEPTFRAQNIAIWTGILGALVVLILWVPYTGSTTEGRTSFRVFVMLLGLLWLLQNALELIDGSSFNHTTYFLPLFLLLLFVKPPAERDLYIAGLVLGNSIILIVVVSLILGGRLGIPNGFDVPDNGATRFMFLSELFGIETRWGGPFGSVNYATPVGGLLVMLGFIYHNWNRWILIGVGVLILFLGQARTTYFALAIALLVLVLWSHRFSSWRFATGFRWIVAGIAAVTFALYIALVDPTFNGRTPIWVDYWTQIRESLLTGIGSSGIAEYVVQASTMNPTGIYHLHGHSVYLDGLARYGILWLLITLGVFAVALRATWIARNGVLASRGIALVIFIFLAGSTETIYSWAYVTIYVLALIYTVGLARFSDPHSESKEIGSPIQY